MGAQAEGKVGRTTISLRPALQYQLQTFSDDDEQSGDQQMLLRTRLGAKYEPSKKLDVYASAEPHFAFNAEYPIDNWRNTVGVKYEFVKGRKLDLFYIYRPDYAKSYNRTFHIIGVDFDLDLKWPRRAPASSSASPSS